MEEIRCNLLRTRKHYKRSDAVNKLLQSLSDVQVEDILFFENEIVKQEEILYQLLHKKIQLDSKLENYARRNMTFTNEYIEADYDFNKTCKALDSRFLEYQLLLKSLEVAVEQAENEVLKYVV